MTIPDSSKAPRAGLGNWNRWADDPGRGSLNLLTPERTVAALALAREGRIYELGAEVGKRGVITGKRNPTWHVTTSVGSVDADGRAEDVLMMHTHAHTHIDGLGHVWFDGTVFDGVDAANAVGRGGAKFASVANYGGIVGRAVLLDVAHSRPQLEGGHAITAEELEVAAGHAGVRPRSGDIVLIRTGWTGVFRRDEDLFHSGAPGLGPDGAEWIAASDPAAVGMDAPAIDPMPAPPGVHPLACHRRFLHQLGTPLIENLELDEAAAAGVHEALFMAAPLRIDGGLGSPLNPLLIV